MALPEAEMASGAGSRAKKKAVPSRRPRVWSSIGFLRRGTRPDLMGFLHPETATVAVGESPAGTIITFPVLAAAGN